MRARPIRPLSRASVVALGLVAVALTTCATTYRAALDGPAAPFFGALGCSALAAVAAVWLCGPLVRARLGAVAALPAFVTLLMASPAVVAHSSRLANRHAELSRALQRPVAYGAVVEPALQGAASFRADAAAVQLRAPAGSTGYLEVKRSQPGPRGWLLPYALAAAPATEAGAGTREALEWTAAVRQDNRYFVLVDTGVMQAQLVNGTRLLLTVMDAAGKPAETRTLTLPAGIGAGDWHTWRLLTGAQQASLGVDSQLLFTVPVPAAIPFLRIGETRTDAEHGGELQLRALRYSRSLGAGAG